MTLEEYFGYLGFTVTTDAIPDDLDDVEFSLGKKKCWSPFLPEPTFTRFKPTTTISQPPKYDTNATSKDIGIPINPLDKLKTYNRSYTPTSSTSTSSTPTPLNFKNSINATYISNTSISPHYVDPTVISFRNNLTTVVHNSGVHWLVIAASNTIYIHDISTTDLSFVAELNIITDTPRPEAVDRAVMPFVQHTINYIAYFHEQNVIVLADDYSRVVVLDVQKLVDAYNGTPNTPPVESLLNINIDMITSSAEISAIGVGFSILTEASVWGVTMYKDMIIVSDNSHRVSSYRYSHGGITLIGTSNNLGANISSVEVVGVEEGVYRIACTDVDGYIHILDRTMIHVDVIKVNDEMAWLCKHIPNSCFLQVSTPSELTGDQFLGEELITGTIAQSLALDDKTPELLGIAAKLQHVHVPSMSSLSLEPSTTYAVAQDIQLNRRLQISTTDTQESNSLFFAGTTNAGLFNDYLTNLASTTNMFPVFNDKELLNYRNYHLNRINLTCDLSKVQAIAVASQAGQLAIIRFTELYGIKAYRVEKILLDPENNQHGSLIGLSSTISGHDKFGNVEYIILITYIDFTVVKYKISIVDDVKNTGNNNDLNIYKVI